MKNRYQQMMDIADMARGQPRISAKVKGKLIEVKLHDPSRYDWEHPRGEIKDFSPQARKRMLRRFWTIDFEANCKPLFMTLTYPDESADYSRDARNIHRAVMKRHLEKLTGRHIPAAWRVEWQMRKSGQYEGRPAPHWHWLIFTHRYIDCTDVNRLWKKTLGWDGYCRTEIKAIRRSTVVQKYMAKYISKDACPLSLVKVFISQQIGRSYGWLRPESIPWYPTVEINRLSEAQWGDMEHLANEQLPWWTPGQQGSFSLTGAVAQDAGRILQGESLDE